MQEGAATPEIPMTLEEKQGCGCHSLEKESWQMSPHGQVSADGQPVATSATCHGEYVEGHPEKGMIPLATDSSACTDCHEQTAAEWKGTVHAEAGIQCISCHLSHTQDLRGDERPTVRDLPPRFAAGSAAYGTLAGRDWLHELSPGRTGFATYTRRA